MKIFNKDKDFIRIGKNNFVDSKLILSIQMQPFIEDEEDYHNNLYKIVLLLDFSPQYPISKYIYITYSEFSELLYKYPDLMGEDNSMSQHDFIMSLEVDPSEELASMEYAQRNHQNLQNEDEEDEKEEIITDY